MAVGKKTGGRAKGVPNVATREVKAALQKHGPALVRALIKLTKSEDERVRLGAIQAALDRGWGKPALAVDLTGQVQIQAIERVIVQPQQLAHGPVPDTTPEIVNRGDPQPNIVPIDDAAIVNNSGDSAE